jgi:hypothetical protein
LCGADVPRELVAVTETGTDLDRAWAQQAVDALLALGKAGHGISALGALTGAFQGKPWIPETG